MAHTIIIASGTPKRKNFNGVPLSSFSHKFGNRATGISKKNKILKSFLLLSLF